MTMNRRQMLSFGGLLLGCSLLATPAATQESYPSRPVNLVVPSAPGGTTDFTARLLAENLTRALGQNFVVENIGGGAGNIGNTKVATANPMATRCCSPIRATTWATRICSNRRAGTR